MNCQICGTMHMPKTIYTTRFCSACWHDIRARVKRFREEKGFGLREAFDVAVTELTGLWNVKRKPSHDPKTRVVVQVPGNKLLNEQEWITVAIWETKTDPITMQKWISILLVEKEEDLL